MGDYGCLCLGLKFGWMVVCIDGCVVGVWVSEMFSVVLMVRNSEIDRSVMMNVCVMVVGFWCVLSVV